MDEKGEEGGGVNDEQKTTLGEQMSLAKSTPSPSRNGERTCQERKDEQEGEEREGCVKSRTFGVPWKGVPAKTTPLNNRVGSSHDAMA